MNDLDRLEKEVGHLRPLIIENTFRLDEMEKRLDRLELLTVKIEPACTHGDTKDQWGYGTSMGGGDKFCRDCGEEL